MLSAVENMYTSLSSNHTIFFPAISSKNLKIFEILPDLCLKTAFLAQKRSSIYTVSPSFKRGFSIKR